MSIDNCPAACLTFDGEVFGLEVDILKAVKYSISRGHSWSIAVSNNQDILTLSSDSIKLLWRRKTS